ncbi:hypothetical protein GGS23DRAFT_226890 [Durotheca rogersii]|uniref:uncharacterized protein n=1 Tax=Durotheca rogersii TaxID=419775 RepID=UPI00221FE676|nr:uncharacterized protein GGS23DRAFT_226890 [Durotheca rogersii]KAI5860511.1 hypothetical protein GGS23DRAFT_226890 [Durotheca rogersii]
MRLVRFSISGPLFLFSLSFPGYPQVSLDEVFHLDNSAKPDFRTCTSKHYVRYAGIAHTYHTSIHAWRGNWSGAG